MEEFRPTENILATWAVHKSSHMLVSSVIVLVPLAAFIAAFVGIYIILQSTNIVLLAVPVLLLVAIIPAVKEFVDIASIYKGDTLTRLSENGVYVKRLDNGGQEEFMSWFEIKQFDLVTFPAKSFVEKLVPRPTRFLLHGEDQTKYMQVDAIGSDAALFRDYLQQHNIAFGFMK